MLQNTSSFPRLGAGLIVAAVALVGVLIFIKRRTTRQAPPRLPPRRGSHGRTGCRKRGDP